MITANDLKKIKNELQKYFPDIESIENQKECQKQSTPKDTSDYEAFYLYLNKGKKVVLKFSRDYLEQRNFEEFCKHLQRNIYYVMKSNMDKSIYLLKNFEIEVGESTYA